MKRFILLFLVLLLLIVSCEVNVYIDNSKKIWRVGNIYFETANEAVNYIMTGSRSRSVTKTDDARRTITLTRPVLAENSDGVIDSSYEGYVEDENLRGEIKIPAGFEGDLCIDFNGYRYDFSNSSDAFFVIEGGDNIYIYNGTTVIFDEASHTPFAIAVNTDTVTIDAHLLDDRRVDNNLVYVGESGHFRIVDVKPDETQNTFGGAVAVVTDGTSGAVLDIESSEMIITDIYTMYKNADGTVSETIDNSIVLSNTAKSVINVYSGAVTIKNINQSSDYYNSITTTAFDKAYLNILGKKEETEVQGGHEIYEVVEKAIENSTGEAEYRIYHVLTHYPAVEVTCTTDGNIEYWHCSECGGYFSDEGITKITEEEVFTLHHTISEDGTYDTAPKTYVAQVGSTKYTDAVVAFNTAKKTGDTVIILADCSVERDKLPNGVEFDLNGHTIVESYTDYVMTPSTTLDGANIYINMWAASYYAKWSTDQNGNSCPEYLLVTDDTSYSYDGKSPSVAFELAKKMAESTTNPYAFIYKLTETAKTRVISSFDGDSTALKYFTGGRGTEGDPFQISSSEDWRNLYYFDQDTWDYYFILNDDIDFGNSLPRGYTLVDFYLNGNGKKIKNVAGPLFDQNWIYAELHIKDLTFEDCNSEYSLISKYGIYNGYKEKNLVSTFENVDVVSSTCKEGSFFYPWVYTESGENTSSYSVTFADCNISSSTLNDNIGSQGYVAAFVANSKDFVTLTSCTLSDTKISASANAAGMVGTNGKIDNCSIDNRSTIEQKSSSNSVAAMAGSATITNSTCFITITAPSMKIINDNGFDAVVKKITDLGFSGDNFEINENGDIKYNGSKEIEKLKIIQRVNLNRLSNGTFINGGFPTYFDTDEHEFSSISDSSAAETTLTDAVKYVKTVKNVTDETNIANVLDCVTSALPTGLSYNSEGFAYSEGTLYLKANQGSNSSSNYFAGTHKDLDRTTTTITVTVYFSAYDDNNTLLGTVTKGYTVSLNKNN